MSPTESLPVVPSAPAAAMPAAEIPPASTQRRAASVVMAALLGGALVSVLGIYQAPGVGWTLAVWTAALTWIGVAKLRERQLPRAERGVLAAIGALGALLCWRASPTLTTFNLMALVVAAALLPAMARGTWGRLGLWTATTELLGGGLGAAFGAAKYCRNDLDSGVVASSAWQRMRAPVIGVVLVLPLLVLFTGLFASADRTFAHLLSKVMGAELLSTTTAVHVLVAVAVSWLLIGLSQRAATVPSETPATSSGPRLGTTEVLTGTVLLNLLFLVFAALQLLHIAGFQDALSVPGVTYSSSAREGFFQLLVVTGVVSAVVLVADWVVLGAKASAVRAVRLSLASLLVLTVGIAMSALWRMSLYTESYGLTELRFYASATMVWLCVVLASMTGTVLVGRRDRFVVGLAGWSFVALVGLNAVNPDGVIARVNIERELSEHTVSLDTWYLRKLSDDALPVVRSYADTLSGGGCARLSDLVDARCRRAQSRQRRWPALSFHPARYRASTLGCSK